MSSDRRSVQGDLPDAVTPPTGGNSPNPNPHDEVAANRARFEEMQQKIQHEREEAIETIGDVRQRVVDQYEDAIHDPEHERFVQEQVAHELSDPPHSVGGHERTGDQESLVSMPANVEIGQHAPKPTTPRSAERFNNEE